MQKLIKIIVAILLLVGFISLNTHCMLVSNDQNLKNKERIDLESARKLLERGIRFFSEEDLLKAEEMFHKLDQNNSNYTVKFLLSFTQSNLTLYYLAGENKEKAIKYNDKAIQNAELSIKLKDNYSDSHALLGNLYGMKIGLNGTTFAAIKYSLKSKKELKKALQLDNNNPRAHLYVGISKLYTPKMYGGSIEEAIAHFKQAIQLDTSYYDAYVYLNTALIEKKDYQGAYSALSQAIYIDPQRGWAKIEMEKLKRLMDKGVKKKTKLRGQIIDKQSAKPISEAKLYVKKGNIEIYSRDDGRFQIELDPGKYEILIVAKGYYPIFKEVVLQEDKVSEITVNLEQGLMHTEKITVVANPSGFLNIKDKAQGSKLSLLAKDIYSATGGRAEVFEILKFLPGTTGVGDTVPIAVRGGNPEENLFLYDQVCLLNPYHMHSAGSIGSLFSVFDSSIVENVAFFSGGFGAKYGDTLSGVIDIRSRRANNTKHSGNIFVSIGGFNMRIEGPIVKDSNSFIFTARKNFSNLILKQQHIADEFAVFPTYWDCTGKISQKINNNNTLEVFYSQSRDNMVYQINERNYQGNLSLYSNQKIINFRHISFISSKGFSELSISKNTFSNNFEFTESMWSKNKLSQYHLRWDLAFNLHPKHLIETGFETKNQTLVSTGYYPENEYEWTSPDSSWEVYRSKVLGNKYGIYIQDQFEVRENLFATFGIRGDYFNKTKSGNTDFRFSLAYAIDDSTILKASTGTYHQFPYLEYLYDDIGNCTLKPMLAYHFNLGIEKNFQSGIKTNFEIYYKKYDNLILEDEDLNYSNKGYGRGRGLELLIQKTEGTVTGWLSYSYSLSKRKELDFIEELPSNYDVPHNLTVNTIIKLPGDFELGGKYRYASGRPYTPIISADYNQEKDTYYPNYGKKQSVRYPEYIRLDAKLSRFFYYKKLSFLIFFELNNILNHRNIIRYDYNDDYSSKTPLSLIDRLYFIGMVVLF